MFIRRLLLSCHFLGCLKDRISIFVNEFSRRILYSALITKIMLQGRNCRHLVLLLSTIIILLYVSFSTHPKPGFLVWKTSVDISIVNQNTTQQDDPDVIGLIRSNYLIPPAPAQVKLNFSRPIWESPVAKVVRRVLKNKTEGFFVECGAFNGEWLSNSIEFEHYSKWKGVLIEGDPNYQAQLLTKRRKAWFVPACMSPQPYPMTITMQRHKEWPAMSNIPSLFYGKTQPGDFPFQFQIQCFPLYSILLALEQTVIDYLSLDVEGAEWSILQTIPFDKVDIKVISIEKTANFEKSEKYLQSLGYKQIAFVSKPFVKDAVFVHHSVSN